MWTVIVIVSINIVSSDSSLSCVFELSHDVAVSAPLPRPTTQTTSSSMQERNPTAVRPREDVQPPVCCTAGEKPHERRHRGKTFITSLNSKRPSSDPHRRETALLQPAWETPQLLQTAEETLLHLNESRQQHKAHFLKEQFTQISYFNVQLFVSDFNVWRCKLSFNKWSGEIFLLNIFKTVFVNLQFKTFSKVTTKYCS